MNEVAQEAEVSRRTVYLYFPNLDTLLVEAAIEGTRASVEAAFELTEDIEERVEAAIRAVHRFSVATEKLGRTLIRLTVERPAEMPLEAQPPRGFRRIEWIELALEPLREVLPAAEFERLVSALTMVVGWEALLVLEDVRGLTLAEAEDVSVWAAQALLAAAMGTGARAPAPHRSQPPAGPQ